MARQPAVTGALSFARAQKMERTDIRTMDFKAGSDPSVFPAMPLRFL